MQDEKKSNAINIDLEEPEKNSDVFINSEESRNKEVFLFIKRAGDIILSFVGIIVVSPILLIISVLIKLDSKGPIMFNQDRVGKNKKVFTIYKFRTMTTDTPKNSPAHMLKDAEKRLTRVGRFLREISFDELPQFLNILKGDMSIIGPRPVIPQEQDQIDERDKYGANDIRPGITGLAQVSGRNKLGVYEKAYYDGLYKKEMSVWFDIKIFLISIWVVLRRVNIHPEINEDKGNGVNIN